MEGGGNNIFGQEGLDLLKGMAPEKRMNYIMMEMIVPEVSESIFIEGDRSYLAKTVSEVSQYGLITSDRGEIKVNLAEGYLIRTKAHDEKEGGIMTGGGALGYLEME